jgi:hypothetical protein
MLRRAQRELSIWIPTSDSSTFAIAKIFDFVLINDEIHLNIAAKRYKIENFGLFLTLKQEHFGTKSKILANVILMTLR